MGRNRDSGEVQRSGKWGVTGINRVFEERVLRRSWVLKNLERLWNRCVVGTGSLGWAK